MNDSKAPLGSNRDRHDNIGDGLLGEKLGVFLGHPKLQGLPALLEVPGRDGHGPDAEEMREAARALRASYEAIRANTRNEGSPTGSSKNSGLTQPSSPPGSRSTAPTSARHIGSGGAIALTRAEAAATRLGRAEQIEVDLASYTCCMQPTYVWPNSSNE